DQRGLARSRHAGHAHQALERNTHIEVLQVVLGCAPKLEPAVGAGHGHHTLRGTCAVRWRLGRRSDRPAAAEVLAGEGSGAQADLTRSAIKDDLAAALAGPGPQV